MATTVPEKAPETVEEKVNRISSKLAEIEAIVSNALKVEKQTVQVVVEKEAGVVKVRRKVLVKTATSQKEVWEDATDDFTQEEKEKMINGI